MSESWLKELESNLNKKLSEFLDENTYQASLFREQSELEEYRLLHSKKEMLQCKAQKHRDKLLELAKDIKNWQQRSYRAKSAGAKELASRAKEQVKKLMEEGRTLWSELDQIGREFKKIDKRMISLSKERSSEKESLDTKWGEFETEQVLDQLRKKMN